MMREIFEKYMKNFNKFSIYFILAIIIRIINSNFSQTFIDTINLSFTFDFKDIFSKDFFRIIAFSLVEIYIFVYGLITVRNVISENPINHREALVEAFSYYPKMFVINLIYLIVFVIIIFIPQFLMVLLSLNPLLMGLYVIFLIISVSLLSVFMGATENYIVYYDDEIGFSIKQGIEVGKHYFFKILGLLLIGAVSDRFLSSDMFKFGNIDLHLNIIFTSLYSIYLAFYIMSLCKMRGRVSL